MENATALLSASSAPLQAFVSLLWTVILGISLYAFRDPLVGLLHRANEFYVILPNGTEMKFPAKEVENAGKEPLTELGVPAALHARSSRQCRK